jgi:hypothetical protein
MCTIIIPSAGRADGVLTDIADAVLYVPENEAEAYAKHNPGKTIETHPQKAHKNLAEKRQDILERWKSVFMVDDDIVCVRRLWIEGNFREQVLTASEISNLISTTEKCAENAGCFLYGFNATPNAKHFYPGKPIELTTYINACAFGIREGSDLYFTPKTTAAESHWINLLNAYMYRKCWVDMRFHFLQAPNSTFFRPGGQTEHRTSETERSDTLFLRKMFGQAVQMKINRGDSGKIHRYQRSIKNPL